LRVFVSSASGALARYRETVVEICHRLGYMPVHMEEFDPQRPTPEQVCREKVENCDVFVLLLAHRYGSRPPGQRRSYTELEYRWAMGCPPMNLLAFVVDPAFPWPPREVDRGADAEQLAALMSEVEAHHVVRHFGELAAFREDLLVALSRQQRVPGVSGRLGAVCDDWDSVPRPPAFHASPPYVGASPFTGRAIDLDILDEWARSDDPVLVIEAIGGTGKSALAWQWVQDRAQDAVAGLAGRLWWSFYEGSNSVTRFLQELVAYTSAQPMARVRRLRRAELTDMALAALRERPYVVVLDGFERLLAAYHRFDPSKLRDEEVDEGQRSLIEPQADDVVRRLAGAGPSKILVSSRLMPAALQGRTGQQMPGVRHVRLPGLGDADMRVLLRRLGIRGSDSALDGFFGPLGNHPLLIGIVAGLVAEYRPEPGGFDRWLDDPTAGAALRVSGLGLTGRSSHILAAALDGLQPWPRQLLGWLSVLSGAVSWHTLEALSPYSPKPPTPARLNLSILGPRPKPPGQMPFGWRREDYAAASKALDQYEAELKAWNKARARFIEQTRREQLAEWGSTEPVAQGRARLDIALKDLEDRGLLWWDRPSNSYDLHPIVRAYVHAQLEASERIKANDWIRKHFASLPSEDLDSAASVEDLNRTITIFRTLVGAGHLTEAGGLWHEGLADVLQHRLGAHSTVVELLTPVAQVRPHLNDDLAISYWFMGRYGDAIRLETEILDRALEERSVVEVRFGLGNLSVSLRDVGSLASATLCCELIEALNTTGWIKSDGTLILYRAILAAIQGQAKQALRLLDQAEGLGPTGKGLWHSENIWYWRCYLALKTDEAFEEAQIYTFASRTRSWQHRRHAAALRYEFHVKHEQFEQAMAAAAEHDRLSRNAGLDIAPARSSFMLAKLGRADEAAAAAEESLTRLPRIHPARFPHYYLAQALWELNRHGEATEHARKAYQLAWCDGPLSSRHWDLRDARVLIRSMGQQLPDLPAVTRDPVTVPLESKIRRFITALKT